MTTQEFDTAVQATWDARLDIGELVGAQSDGGRVTAWDARTEMIRIGVYADKLTQAVIDSVCEMVANADATEYHNQELGGVVLIPPQDVSGALDFRGVVTVHTVIRLSDGTLRGIVGAVYP